MSDKRRVTSLEYIKAKSSGNMYWRIRTDVGWLRCFDEKQAKRLTDNGVFMATVTWDDKDPNCGILKSVESELNEKMPVEAPPKDTLGPQPTVPHNMPGTGYQPKGTTSTPPTGGSAVVRPEHPLDKRDRDMAQRILMMGAVERATAIIAAKMATSPAYSVKSNEELCADMHDLSTRVMAVQRALLGDAPCVASPNPVEPVKADVPSPTPAVPAIPAVAPTQQNLPGASGDSDPAWAEDAPTQIVADDPIGVPAVPAPVPAPPAAAEPAPTVPGKEPPELFSGAAKTSLRNKLAQLKGAAKP